jgi:hypothetical protein
MPAVKPLDGLDVRLQVVGGVAIWSTQVTVLFAGAPGPFALVAVTPYTTSPSAPDVALQDVPA